MTVADMFEWQQEQKYRLRTGRRAYTGPAYREGGACRQTGVQDGRRTSSSRSLSLDGISFGEG